MTATATIQALATDIIVSVDDPRFLGVATEHTQAVAARLEAAVNRECPNAEIIALDRSDGRPVAVSSLLEQLIIESLYRADLTDDADAVVRGPATDSPVPAWHRVQLGWGTVTVPAGLRLELMSTARAFLVDRTTALLREKLDCGVNIQVGPTAGSHRGGRHSAGHVAAA